MNNPKIPTTAQPCAIRTIGRRALVKPEKDLWLFENNASARHRKNFNNREKVLTVYEFEMEQAWKNNQ